jgi:aspartyl-tRNA(Asn)/glutamyl-tRNA(Gln) amidotransferase subunit A
MPTTAGTTAPGIAFPRRDSAAVARLRRAGAMLIGKTRTHEFAWGNVTPPVRNPWALDRVPSGSSGGSGAAVAAGLCAAAMGSDTGGSIRMPVAACGVVGLKATFGRVSRDGIVPHSWSLDHAGPLTRSVTDAAILMNALAGTIRGPGVSRQPVPDYRADLERPIDGLRLGVCRNHFFEDNQEDVQRRSGGHPRPRRPGRDRDRLHDSEPRLRPRRHLRHRARLVHAYHDVSLREGRVRHYTPDVRQLVEIGRFVTGSDYLKAEQVRAVLMEDFRRALDRVDVILGPTTPITAWKIGEWTARIGDRDESVLAASWRFTFPYNLTGLPAISVPCGFDRHGLPIGLQIAGRPFDEATVLRVAHAYERTHEWKERAPAL